MKSILDKSFQYTPALDTDVRRTFQRIVRQIEEEKAATASVEPTAEDSHELAGESSGRVSAAAPVQLLKRIA